jgi:hypothetical protein
MSGLPDLLELWDFSDPVKSEARFRDAAESARGAGDSGYP